MLESETRPSDTLLDRAAGSKPVDLAHLRRFTMGDQALEREVLELFTDQAPIYLGRLGRAGNDQDWRQAAHSMKGSAAAIGAWRVAHFAARAESLASSDDYLAMREEAIAQLCDAVDEASAYISGLFAPA